MLTAVFISADGEAPVNAVVVVVVVFVVVLAAAAVGVCSTEVCRKNCSRGRQVERENLFEEIIQCQVDVFETRFHLHLEAISDKTSKSTNTGPRSAARFKEIFFSSECQGLCSSVGRAMDCRPDNPGSFPPKSKNFFNLFK